MFYFIDLNYTISNLLSFLRPHNITQRFMQSIHQFKLL